MVAGGGSLERGSWGLGRARTRDRFSIIKGKLPSKTRIDLVASFSYNSGIMKWVYIEDIGGHAGEPVEVRGWVYHKRSSGKVRFLLIRDGTGTLQATLFSAA